MILDEEIKNEVLKLKKKYSFFSTSSLQMPFLIESGKGCFVNVSGAGDIYLSQLDNPRLYKLSSDGELLWEKSLTDGSNDFSGRASIASCNESKEICIFDSKNNEIYFVNEEGEILNHAHIPNISSTKILMKQGKLYLCDTASNRVLILDQSLSEVGSFDLAEIPEGLLVSSIAWDNEQKNIYVCYLKYDHPQEYFVYVYDTEGHLLKEVVHSPNQGVTMFNLLLEVDLAGNVYLFEKNGRMLKYSDSGELIFSLNDERKIRSVSSSEQFIYVSLIDGTEILRFQI